MNEQSAADDELRDVIGRWVKAHGRDEPGELIGDIVAVVHLRSWPEDAELQDDYTLVFPAGVSHHAVVGLLEQGVDIATSDVDDGD